MKRLITTSLIALAFVFSLSATVFATASDRWSASISTPANTTNKTFNVQYTTLSTGQDDDITVELFENGSSKGSQTTTKDFGDSGVFQVTVPGVGTYSYYIKATNSTDATPKNTGTVQVVVSDAPVQTTTSTNTSSTNQAGSQAGTGSTRGANIPGDADGDGVVDDDAATTNKDVKSSEDKKDDKANNNQNTGWYVGLALTVLAGLAGYYYYLNRPRD